MNTETRPSNTAKSNDDSGRPPAGAAGMTYISNTLAIKGTNPLASARDHSKAMIETLHEHLQPKAKQLADDFIDAFHDSYKLEQELHRQENNDDVIPSSCQVDLELQFRKEIKGGEESKALDAATSVVIEKVQKKLKKQVIKAMKLNLKSTRHEVVKSFADALSTTAIGLIAEVNIGSEYSNHQAIADMMYCYGEAIVSSFLLEVTPESFAKAYADVKQTLPPPSRVATQKSPTQPTESTATAHATATAATTAPATTNTTPPPPKKAFNIYSVMKPSSLGVPNPRGVGYVTRRNPSSNVTTPATNPNLRGCTALVSGLSQMDFTTIIGKSTSEYICSEAFYEILSPASKKRKAAEKTFSAKKTLQFELDSTQDEEEEVSPSVEESAKKKARPNDPEKLSLTQRAPLSQPEDEDAHSTSSEESESTQKKVNEQPIDQDANMSNNDDGPTESSTPPNISYFLEQVGSAKAQVIQKLHWLAMTAFIGSINLYVMVVEKREVDLRVKNAMEEAMTERLADQVSFKLAAERSADMPTLKGVVDKNTDPKLAAHERRIQSLEDRVDNSSNKKKKKTKQQNGGKDSGKSKKEPRGAASAASKKKNASNSNNTSRSKRANKQSNQKQGASAGGSGGGTKSGSGKQKQQNKQQQSSKKKTHSKTSKNNKQQQQRRK